MRQLRNNDGFSLTEVLLALGTLAIGMIFIAGVFPVGLYFATISTERTIAAVVADEAFAKVRLYGVNLKSALWQVNPTVRSNSVSAMPLSELAYPSTSSVPDKQYYWSALCRRVSADPNSRFVQVTVFVSRRIGSGPVPIARQVAVLGAAGTKELTIQDPAKQTWINDGYTIVDNMTGQIYRVLERYGPPADDTILLDLDRVWGAGNIPPNAVWVVPPVGGGRYPCIAVYQKVIRF